MNDKNYPKTFTLIQIVVQLHCNKPDDKIETPEERKMLDELFSMLCVYESWHLRGWYQGMSNEGTEGYARIAKSFLMDEKVPYQEKVTNASKAVKINREDWFVFLDYDPPSLHKTKKQIENESQHLKEIRAVKTEEDWAWVIKNKMQQHEASLKFLNKIRELYKKNPFWDEKGLETVKGKKRISKYENEKVQVVKAGKKLIAANPKWRISNIVNKRNGYIHESIKATLRNAGLDETEWPPLSTLATWIGPHVTNKRPGR